MLRSSGISQKSGVLIVRYSQKKERISFAFCYSENPSIAHNFGTTGLIQAEFSAKCTFRSEQVNQTENWKCHNSTSDWFPYIISHILPIQRCTARIEMRLVYTIYNCCLSLKKSSLSAGNVGCFWCTVILITCPSEPPFVIFVDCYFVCHFVDLFISPHQVGVPCSFQFDQNHNFHGEKGGMRLVTPFIGDLLWQ